MKNLTWISEQKISIIITNYKYFLSESPSAKSAFIFDFKMIIFPFWKKDGLHYYEDKQYIKDIDVYLVY